MKNLKVKNFRLLTMLLVAGISFASPVNVHAEEGEILYIQEVDEQEEEELTEETIDEMIDAAEAAAAGTGPTGAASDDLSAGTGTIGTGVGSAIGEGAEAGTGTGAGTGAGTGTGTGAATGEGQREFGANEFIDADNWSQELDADPNAGKEIPAGTQTEAQRKGINPPGGNPGGKPGGNPGGNPGGTPETEEQNPGTPETEEEKPTPAPKTGESESDYYLKYIKTGLGISGIMALLAIIADMVKKGISYTKFLNEQDKLEIDEEPVKVIKSRKKKQKKNKSKSLRREN